MKITVSKINYTKNGEIRKGIMTEITFDDQPSTSVLHNADNGDLLAKNRLNILPDTKTKISDFSVST